MTNEFDWEYTWKDSNGWVFDCDSAFVKVSMLEYMYIIM